MKVKHCNKVEWVNFSTYPRKGKKWGSQQLTLPGTDADRWWHFLPELTDLVRREAGWHVKQERTREEPEGSKWNKDIGFRRRNRDIGIRRTRTSGTEILELERGIRRTRPSGTEILELQSGVSREWWINENRRGNDPLNILCQPPVVWWWWPGHKLPVCDLSIMDRKN